MYVYACVYVCVCMCMYVRAYMYIDVCVYACMCVCVYVKLCALKGWRLQHVPDSERSYMYRAVLMCIWRHVTNQVFPGECYV